jgi:hypothetical protein
MEQLKTIKIVHLSASPFLRVNGERVSVYEEDWFDIKNSINYSTKIIDTYIASYTMGRIKGQIVDYLIYGLLVVLNKFNLNAPRFFEKYSLFRMLKSVGVNENQLSEFDHVVFSHSFLLFNQNFKNRYLYSLLQSKITNFYLQFTESIESISFSPSSKDFLKNILALQRSGSFKRVVTFSKDDALEYGFEYGGHFAWGQFTPRFDIDKIISSEYYEPEKYDITLVSNAGPPSAKFHLAYSILNKCIDKGYKVATKTNGTRDENLISHFTKEDQTKYRKLVQVDTLKSDEPIARDFVNRILNTKCVLHVAASDYVTLTHCEAAKYDRKLLCTSPSIKDQPWYNPNFVRYVDCSNVTEEDINWIVRPVKVSYEHKELFTWSGFLAWFVNQTD